MRLNRKRLHKLAKSLGSFVGELLAAVIWTWMPVVVFTEIFSLSWPAVYLTTLFFVVLFNPVQDPAKLPRRKKVRLK